MKYWAWESCRRDGCRFCSLWTISATVRLLQSSVWRYLSVIRRSFCVVSWPSTKHGSTGTHQKPRYSWNWVSPGKRAPKKAKTVLSAGKLMATVFWDSQGVIYIDYLEKGKMITGLYYAELLGRFDAELKKKRPHLAKKKVLFHNDNAPANTSVVSTAKMVEN